MELALHAAERREVYDSMTGTELKPAKGRIPAIIYVLCRGTRYGDYLHTYLPTYQVPKSWKSILGHFTVERFYGRCL